MNARIEERSNTDRKAVGTMFTVLLADQFAIRTRMRNCRWNVPGLPSHALNELFASHAETLDGMLDAMANQARVMGNDRIVALAAFLKLARSKAHPGVHPPASQTTGALLAGHEVVLDQLRAGLEDCTEHSGDVGVVALFKELVEKHENMARDLRTVLKETRLRKDTQPEMRTLCAC